MSGGEEASRKALAEQQIERANQIGRKAPWLFQLPFINQYDDLTIVAQIVALQNPQDFNWAVSFDPDFLGELMFHGFLTMCEKVSKDVFVVFPKLHMQRCLLDLKDLHIPKSVRKRSKGFSMTMNKDFGKVCKKIVEQHGQNWFYPPLVQAFKAMNDRGSSGCFHGNVFVVSFELWDNATGELVAGEVGYNFGSCYTSLSGFSSMDSAGSVQMAATGSFLFSQGYTLWDLGMVLEYKEGLGAKSVPRSEFLKRLAKSKQVDCVRFLQMDNKTPARDLIQQFVEKRTAIEREREKMREKIRQKLAMAENSSSSSSSLASASTSESITTAPPQVSKSQQKRLAKLAKRQEYLEEKKKRQKQVEGSATSPPPAPSRSSSSLSS